MKRLKFVMLKRPRQWIFLILATCAVQSTPKTILCGGLCSDNMVLARSPMRARIWGSEFSKSSKIVVSVKRSGETSVRVLIYIVVSRQMNNHYYMSSRSRLVKPSFLWMVHGSWTWNPKTHA